MLSDLILKWTRPLPELGKPKVHRSDSRCGGYSGRSTDIGVVMDDERLHDLDLILLLDSSEVEKTSKPVDWHCWVHTKIWPKLG